MDNKPIVIKVKPATIDFEMEMETNIFEDMKSAMKKITKARLQSMNFLPESIDPMFDFTWAITEE